MRGLFCFFYVNLMRTNEISIRSWHLTTKKKTKWKSKVNFRHMHLIFFNMQSLIFSSVKTWITSCAIKEVFRTQCIILSKTSWLFVLFIKSFIPIEWTAIVLLNSLFFASGHAQHDKVKLRVSAELVFFFFFFVYYNFSESISN